MYFFDFNRNEQSIEFGACFFFKINKVGTEHFLYVCPQTPEDPDLKSFVYIVKTNFTRNSLDLMKREICNAQNGTSGPSWGGAIFMGSTRSINPDGTNFTLEKGRLSCVLEELVFKENVADNGGAIAFVRASFLQLDDVHFVQNKATSGGAMLLELDGDPHPQVGFEPIHYVNGGGLLFQQNRAHRGGALYTHVRCGTGLDLVGISPYNITRRTSNITANNEDAIFIENSTFTRNCATESGGAWHVNSGRVGCLSCSFLNNSVEGGSDANGGGIAMMSNAALHAREVILMQNKAKHGGAIYAEDSLVDIAESEIVANVAERNGGGLYVQTSATVRFRLGTVGLVENSTFDANAATIGGKYMHICHSSVYRIKLVKLTLDYIMQINGISCCYCSNTFQQIHILVKLDCLSCK